MTPDRTLAIGGSEIAALFGAHDYLDAFTLWLRKKGKLPPPEGAGKTNRRMLLGIFLEQGIVAYYSYLTGKKTEWRNRREYHPKYPFMAYSVDAVVAGERRGVDAKCISWDQSWKWGETVDDIPPYVVMQAWWYMAALDYDFWDIAALVRGEDEPRIYTVNRDREMEQLMLERAEEWWRRYLVGDERPPIQASHWANGWLKQSFPRHPKNDVVKAAEKQIALLEEYAQAYRQFDVADEKLKELEIQVKEQIGLHEGLTWPGGKITWRLTKDSAFVEWQKLAQLLIEGRPDAPRLMAEHTQKKEGARRLYFSDRRGRERETR